MVPDPFALAFIQTLSVTARTPSHLLTQLLLNPPTPRRRVITRVNNKNTLRLSISKHSNSSRRDTEVAVYKATVDRTDNKVKL
jgi:hypothetical protein